MTYLSGAFILNVVTLCFAWPHEQTEVVKARTFCEVGDRKILSLLAFGMKRGAKGDGSAVSAYSAPLTNVSISYDRERCEKQRLKR